MKKFKIKKKGGRPFFDEKDAGKQENILSKLEFAFSMGCSDLEACAHANISVAALYRYQEKNPEFRERKNVLKKTPTLKARITVVKGLESDKEFALKYLERKERDEFFLKSKREEDGPVLFEPIKIIRAKPAINLKEKT